MSNEDKILEFNMGGFILKLVFSIGICVLLLKVTASEKLMYNILSGTVYFCWDIPLPLYLDSY